VALDPEALVTGVAAKYDNEEGDLQRAALRRLEYRRSRSGKTCSVCELTKPLSAFGVDARKPDGLDPRCRACEAIRRRETRRKVLREPPHGD
jgi:hypothetical protein